MTATSEGGLLLAIDTSTSRAVLALGRSNGTLLAADMWDAGHRHVEELLPRLEGFLEGRGLDRAALASLSGIVVGTGPGAFTGLRVGIATAKALALAFDRPLLAIGSGAALLAAAADADPATDPARLLVLMPAGPTGRYVVTVAGTRVVIGDEMPDLAPGSVPVAVDLAARAPDAAVARGEAAIDRFPGMLLRLGAARLAAGGADEPAEVVPEYVSLPRGAARDAGAARSADAAGAGIVTTWSPARP